MSAAAERAQQMWWGRPDADVIQLRPRPLHAAPPPARGQGRAKESGWMVVVAVACVVLSAASLVVTALNAWAGGSAGATLVTVDTRSVPAVTDIISPIGRITLRSS